MRDIAISARAVGDEDAGDDAAAEMEQMPSRHSGAAWYPAARATLEAWTERTLAARDAGEVDAMAEVLPLYTAHPERPGVRALIEAWRRDAQSDLAASQAWEDGLWQAIDIRPLLGGVRCRTLLLVGELDMICGPAHARMIAAALPSAEIVAVPERGHFVPSEAPEQFRDAVLRFAPAETVESWSCTGVPAPAAWIRRRARSARATPTCWAGGIARFAVAAGARAEAGRAAGI